MAGSNPLESVNRYYLYYMKAESPIQFSVNYLLHELQALTLGSGEPRRKILKMKFSGVTLKVAKSLTWLRSLGDPWFTRPNF